VKKSSALDRAKDIIRGVNCCPIAAAQATKEFIARAMSNDKFPGKKFFKYDGKMEEYNQYAIFATEFTQFIGVNPLAMLDFLTTVYTEKVYDCDTKGQGSDLVVGPYITLLACLTPEMMKGYIKMNILTGGFARRTQFVYGLYGEPVPFPGMSQDQRDAGDRCVQWGKQMQAHAGEFKLDEEATEWYTKWYIDLQTNITEISKPATEGYYRTKQEVLFKCGMLVSLSEDLANRTLTKHHLEVVENRFLLPYEKNLERVFEGAGINPNAAAAAQVCRMLEALDRPMLKKRIEAIFFDQATSLSELRDTLDHLCAVGRLDKRDLLIGNRLLGTVIGTPAALKKYSDAEVVEVLKESGELVL
jgi:hypothetical protein